MPTVLRVGPYRLVFHSRGEASEPPHIHVKRERKHAKFWLDPVELAANDKFSRHEVTRILDIVEAHREKLLERWHDHLG